VRANALVPFVMFLIVTCRAVLRRVRWRTSRASSATRASGKKRWTRYLRFPISSSRATVRYDEPTKEGELNNKLSGLRSYRLEDNPEYMKLFPEVLSADGTGGTRERPATPANKAPKAQNMV
jgi:DNA-directed RNA polymerase II subunit RPB7